jgi:UDP-glucose 4-epimerase
MEQTTASVVKKQYMLPREGDIYRSSLSNTMAAQLLNWKPTMPFPEGITKTYQTITTKQKYLSGEENYE